MNIVLVVYFVLCVELDEDWYHSDDPINAGISFYVKVRSRDSIDV